MKWIFKHLNVIVDETEYDFKATMPRTGEIWYTKDGKAYIIQKINWHVSGDLSERVVIFNVAEL